MIEINPSGFFSHLGTAERQKILKHRGTNLTGDIWSDLAVTSSFCRLLHTFINPYALPCDTSPCCHGWVEPSSELYTQQITHSNTA